MKTHNILSAMVAVAAAAAFATSASASGLTAPGSPAYIGSAAPAAAAERTITITADTKYVNITGGSTVRFVVGEQSFTWSFQAGGSDIAAFDLAVLAPEGMLNHKVKVYVSANPLYAG